VKQGHLRSHHAGSAANSPTLAGASGGGSSGALDAGGGCAAAPGSSGGRSELNLHALTAGVAMISLYLWLMELRWVRGGVLDVFLIRDGD